ncbi:hypothetical protein [Streptomyces sp. NPDC058695]|uniref:hypothetical protein n=1 Tax=Streptomyces sp. NPDC058695 TaxID=3346604 RepID=UPI00365DE05C
MGPVLDTAPGGIETVIGADSALTDTVDPIMLATGLASLPALERRQVQHETPGARGLVLCVGISGRFNDQPQTVSCPLDSQLGERGACSVVSLSRRLLLVEIHTAQLDDHRCGAGRAMICRAHRARVTLGVEGRC